MSGGEDLAVRTSRTVIAGLLLFTHRVREVDACSGTEGSNPAPSSGESANHRSLARDSGHSRASATSSSRGSFHRGRVLHAPAALPRWIEELPRDRPIAVHCICGFPGQWHGRYRAATAGL
jgi:hypothetical protein